LPSAASIAITRASGEGENRPDAVKMLRCHDFADLPRPVDAEPFRVLGDVRESLMCAQVNLEIAPVEGIPNEPAFIRVQDDQVDVAVSLEIARGVCGTADDADPTRDSQSIHRSDQPRGVD